MPEMIYYNIKEVMLYYLREGVIGFPQGKTRLAEPRIGIG